NKNKNAKKFKRIDLKNLRRLLIHEDFVAGGYDLMDIVALKIIERSKIKTRVLKADIKKLEKAIKGVPVGTEIIIP
ncbi:MAG: UMP kinase, partial [Thermoproteota archaeon]